MRRSGGRERARETDGSRGGKGAGTSAATKAAAHHAGGVQCPLNKNQWCFAHEPLEADRYIQQGQAGRRMELTGRGSHPVVRGEPLGYRA